MEGAKIGDKNWGVITIKKKKKNEAKEQNKNTWKVTKIEGQED